MEDFEQRRNRCSRITLAALMRIDCCEAGTPIGGFCNNPFERWTTVDVLEMVGEILSCLGYILKVEPTGLLTSQNWV